MNKEQIEVPYWKNLRQWREERGLTSDEWEAFAEASKYQSILYAAIGFAIGIIGIALGK